MSSDPNARADAAVGSQFAQWIGSDERQALIAKFAIGGRQVFFPKEQG